MVLKPVCPRTICPGGEQQSCESVQVFFFFLFVFCPQFVLQVWTGCGVQRWQAFKLAVPSRGVWKWGSELGIAADVSCPRGEGAAGWREECLMTRDERLGDLSSPPPHTSLSRHVSVSARSIW